MDPKAKSSFVKSNNLCFNCNSYWIKECKCLGCCKSCSQKHHTSLHRDNFPTSTAEASTNYSSAEPAHDSATVNAAYPLAKLEPTLQMTFQVIVESSKRMTDHSTSSARSWSFSLISNQQGSAATSATQTSVNHRDAKHVQQYQPTCC